jgi:hypothetical protein
MIDISTLQLPTPTNRPALADGLRTLRNKLLNDNVDTVNPVRYATLTTDQQAELAAYRTSLLNIPQQAGWPTTIEWPTKPTWL